eukprot:TRINITY_DN101584_c0_g1_i1.p1 TRINITY_DN101584_c0_g1~~TRINITY_DN101584_c0_g1_i1.p1  ORF type:complete len:903 (-),score=223.70 TRINITY_DN101584_c0_g1_i1:336-3044(-)
MLQQPTPVRAGASLAMSTSQPPSDADGGLEYIYLKQYFGHEEFRPGQREVVQAAVAGKDVAVFWTTGAGKSLCYQLPALQQGKTVVVVSPLISLMQDQVTKFNATVGTCSGDHRACLLGSAQADPQVETDVVNGKYRLVYLTPEKLTGSFLGRLQNLHSRQGLSLLAVDEAHCISDWGHDFRPSFRELRKVRESLPQLPIMALTATAVDRVQTDIVQQLGLRSDTYIARSSFDRTNLKIACTRKTGQAADLQRIASRIALERGATVVYTATQKEVDAVTHYLQERLAQDGIAVAGYHAGKSPAERSDAHFAFLSGKTQVIVATVAFGMGIDKPDIRRVIHYGPPKTVEEYFQQIGRAGRDGQISVCEMIAADNDFAKYGDAFYTQGLTQKAKEVMMASTAALRNFAAEGSCRRKWLLQYFGETPIFGERCGTCDNCCTSKQHGDDTHRDFRQAAAPVLEAIGAVQSFPQPLTQLLAIVAGTWKPKANSSLTQSISEAMPRIQTMREALPRSMRQESFVRELLSMLCSSGHLQRKRIERQPSASQTFCQSFDVYLLTEQGEKARAGKAEIRLPVPAAIRQQEELQRQKEAALAAEVQKAGFDVKKVPKKELESGEGPMFWYIRKLKHWRESGKESFANKHEELRKRIMAWRDASAQKLRMAPADVLSEHIIVNMTYVKPTTLEALRGIGVRIAGSEELVALITNAKTELFADVPDDTAASQQQSQISQTPLQLPAGVWTPPRKWAGAVYKPGKAGAKPPWEVSYDRFAKGDMVQTIAMQQPSGKPVQPSTVVGHLWTALSHGRALNLQLLFQQSEYGAITEADWSQLGEATATVGANLDAADFKAKEVLGGILGADKVNREAAEKNEADKAAEARWYDRIRLYAALKRVGFEPTLSAKRQRCA